MSAKPVNLVVTAAGFPLTYAQAKRATIVNEDISPRLPGDFFGDRVNKDFGTPQMIFCENVMPFDKGLLSVGFVEEVAAIGGGVATADRCITLRDSAERLFSYVPAAGANYVYNRTTAAWASVNPFSFTSNLISTAYVSGRTFVCFEHTKIIEYDSVAGTFSDITLTLPAGYVQTDIRGICGASNYLLLFTEFEILWNAPGILDEFASTDAGAGKQTPIDVKAQITTIQPISGGFIVYTARNAIGATYTDDATAPFNFKEVGNAGGVISAEFVSEGDQSGTAQYIWGTKGLQRVSLSGSFVEYPEVTDFLTGKQCEVWNATTKAVDLTASAAHLTVKLAFLAGRYLVLSYGQGTTYFEFALVLDTALKRWGKLKIQHNAAFMYPYPQGEGSYFYDELPGFYADLPGDYASLAAITFSAIPPKQGLAFIDSTGAINVATLDFSQTAASGVAIFGHLQHRLNREITLHGVELDGVRGTQTVTALLSTTGKTRTAVAATAAQTASGGWQKFNIRKTAKNIDVAVEGTFLLTGAIVRVAENGYR